MSGAGAALVAEGLSRTVDGEVHLAGVSLELERGHLYTLLGPTLAGKTSLLRVLAGLDPVQSGSLVMDHRDLLRAPVWTRSVAMVYQQFINYPHLTVYDNVAFPLRRARRGAVEVDRTVRETAGKLGLAPFLERRCSELSGGQQQRTALARALVKGADLLLLDEPLVNLDYKLREHLREELVNLFSDRGNTIVVYASTEPLEALMLGGTVLVMSQGRLLQAGPTHQVFARPASVEVARIFNDPPMNLLDGAVSNGEVILAGGIRKPRTGHLASLRQGRYRFGIRAGDIRVGGAGVPARIELAEISGSVTYLHVSLAGAPVVIQQTGVHSHALGETIVADIDAAALYAFAEDGQLAVAPASVGDGGAQDGSWRESS